MRRSEIRLRFGKPKLSTYKGQWFCSSLDCALSGRGTSADAAFYDWLNLRFLVEVGRIVCREVAWS